MKLKIKLNIIKYFAGYFVLFQKLQTNKLFCNWTYGHPWTIISCVVKTSLKKSKSQNQNSTYILLKSLKQKKSTV